MAKNNSKQSDKQLIELGKQVAVILDLSRADRKTMMFNSFLRGTAQGFGVVVGGSLVVAFLLWFLGLFDEVPFLTDAVRSIIDTIERN